VDLQLHGKRALVTGSSGGIGQEIARVLAAEGCAVVVHGRDPERVEQAAREIAAAGALAVAVVGDLATDDGAARTADDAVAALGGVDILVNNAASYVNRGWWDAASGDWASLYAANVLSAVRLIGRLAPAMRERGWGRIIQIASGEATQPFAFMPDYAATKAALVNLTVSLAREMTRTGVTVNTVSPGIVVTPGVEAFFRIEAARRGWGSTWAEIEQAVLSDVLDNPTGRLGRVEDVAHLVAFVASPLAGYINSANLRIDGGSTISVN
jgi:NAD(P)-dependent dehydrogenase (short-subunit alcohol dehydrogenase family)